MPRPGLIQSDVSEIADELEAAGEDVTAKAVRLRLGTGSNSTISRYLRAWWAAKDQTRRVASKEHIPEVLITTVKDLWERVIGQADDKIQKSEEEFKQIKIDLTDELKQLQEDNTRWQQQHQEIKQERDGLVHEKSVLEQLLATARIDIAKLTEKIDGLDQRNQEKKAHID